MTYDGYSTLKVNLTDRVARVTIDHPPVNNLDAALASDLISFVREVEHDDSVAVIILESANEEFFVAHADMEFMFDAGPLMALADPDGEGGLNPLQQFHERFRALPQVTIAKLQGFARAGGVELAMAADLRFAAAGKTWLAQPETRMGIFPGGGGTQYLTRLVGRARALEIILGAGLYGTDLAEKYGWINRAIQPDELDDHVTSLAHRIANLPAGVAAAAVEAIDAAEASGAVPVLAEESAAHVKVYPSPESVVEKIRRAVDAGAQTAEGERDLEGLLDSVN